MLKSGDLAHCLLSHQRLSLCPWQWTSQLPPTPSFLSSFWLSMPPSVSVLLDPSHPSKSTASCGTPQQLRDALRIHAAVWHQSCYVAVPIRLLPNTVWVVAQSQVALCLTPYCCRPRCECSSASGGHHTSDHVNYSDAL